MNDAFYSKVTETAKACGFRELPYPSKYIIAHTWEYNNVIFWFSCDISTVLSTIFANVSGTNVGNITTTE